MMGWEKVDKLQSRRVSAAGSRLGAGAEFQLIEQEKKRT
jgi:hypothetical protein